MGERFLAGVAGTLCETVLGMTSTGEASLMVAKEVRVTERERDVRCSCDCGSGDGVAARGGAGNLSRPKRNGS